MPQVAIIGAGLIGRSWAMVFARAGHPVKVYDAAPGAAQKALALIEEGLQELHEFGLITESPAVVAKRISTAPTLRDAVADPDRDRGRQHRSPAHGQVKAFTRPHSGNHFLVDHRVISAIGRGDPYRPHSCRHDHYQSQ